MARQTLDNPDQDTSNDTGGRQYNDDMSGFERNYNENADSSAEDNAIKQARDMDEGGATGATDQNASTDDLESNSTVPGRSKNQDFITNFKGINAKPGKVKFSLNKSKNPLIAILIALGIGGGSIGFLGSNVFLGQAFSSNLVSKFSSSVAMLGAADDNTLALRLFGDTGVGVDCSKPLLKCQYRGITKSEMNALKANGVIFTPENGKMKWTKLGTYTFDSMKLPIDGVDTVVDAKSYNQYKSNKSFKTTLQPVRQSLWKSSKNVVRSGVGKFFNISTNPDTKAATPEELKKKVYDQVHNGTTAVSSRPGVSDIGEDDPSATDGRAADVDLGTTNISDQVAAAEKAVADGTYVSKSLPVGDIVGALGREGTTLDEAKNPFQAGWGWVNSLDGADMICTGYQLANTAASLARTVATVNAIRYGHLFLSAWSKAQAGESSPEEMGELMKILTSKNVYAQSFDASAAAQYIFTGKLTTETPIGVASTGGEALKQIAAGMYAIHQVAGFGTGIDNAIAGRQNLKNICGVATNLGFQIGATVVDWAVTIASSIFTAGGAAAANVGLKAATRVAYTAIKKEVTTVFREKLTNMISKNVTKEVRKEARQSALKQLKKYATDPVNLAFVGLTLVETFGMDYIVQTLAGTDVLAYMEDSVLTADAIVAARAAEDYTSTIAMGGTVQTIAQRDAYMNVNNAEIAANIDYMKSSADPLDTNNEYSKIGMFAGSFATSIATVLDTSSIKQVMKNVTSVPTLAFASLTGTYANAADANTEPTAQNLSDFVGDQYMVAKGLCNDMVGNPCGGADLAYIAANPADPTIDKAVGLGYINEDGTIIPGSTYATHVSECNNPARTQVDATMFDDSVVIPERCWDGSDSRKFMDLITNYRTLYLKNTPSSTVIAAPSGTIVSPLSIAGMKFGNGFGPRASPCAGCSTWHTGFDLTNTSNPAVTAISDGTVMSIAGQNNVLSVKHSDGLISTYWHMKRSDMKVKVGDVVTAGQVIGKIGCVGQCTGPHLHFALDITKVNNPANYAKYTKNTAGPDPPGSRIDPREYFKLNNVAGY
jgi:murein DD-endopeptidase MepM/ murein hydrolase activator NlpD